MIFQADVTQRAQVESMVKAAEETFGAIDVLVNNAYFPFQVSPLHEISWENFHQAIDHELSAFYHCVQACLPAMKEKKAGRIIVVSTRLAQQPLPQDGRLRGGEVGAGIDGQYDGHRTRPARESPSTSSLRRSL